ncbi:beta-lactamase/transpeptidase-like protein [Cubamyces sp. BRFM 1775]|nr:beta-lactamase/transpeptidase-like protein [Cubamyces sp. BRFM 1775]
MQQQSGVPASATESDDTRATPILSANFLAFVEDLRQDMSIPGISLGVVRLADDGQPPATQFAAFGRKLEDGDGHDLTPDTLFCLASCSKAFLAASVGLLIDDFAHGRNTTPLPAGLSRFDWDTKIAAILPEEWQLDDAWSTLGANVRDVLGHVTGLPQHDGAYGPGDTMADIVRRMRDLRTAYELREKYSYNNQMYMLGAHIIEKYSGLTYSQFVAERLLKPLKMSTSTLSPSEAASSGLLTDTWTKDGRRIPFWFTEEDSRLTAGPGGVISSAEDMVKWLAVWLNKGVHPSSGETLIPRSVYDAVTTARQVVEGCPTKPYGAGIVGYGMGWKRWTYEGIEIIMHTGGIPGFSTIVVFSPSSNLGIVVLINADEKAEHILTIVKRAFDDVLNLSQSGVSVVTETPVHIREDLAPPGRPSLGTLSLDLEAYTGTYSSPGYGTFTLCSAQSTSNSCTSVLEDFASLGPLPTSEPHLYAAHKTILSTHVHLRHLHGDVFHVTFPALFPHGYGKDTSAFETYETGSDGWAEFSIVNGKVDGFSLVVDEDAVAARRKRRGKNVTLKDVADAWFEKI